MESRIQYSNGVWQFSENMYTTVNNTNYQVMNSKQNKVFVNPNFQRNIQPINTIHINPHSGILCDRVSWNQQAAVNTYQSYLRSKPLQGTKIHINPKRRNVLIPQNIHVNPRFAPQVKVESKTEIPLLEKKPALVLTKTKLVRAPNTVTVTKPNNQKRRNSVKSKFKIVHNKSCTPIKRPNSKISRYKLDNRSIKSFNLDTIQNKISNRFKRSNAMSLRKIKSLVKTVQASRSLVKINGVMYKKSKNSLKRISVSKVNTRKLSNIVMQSKYKLVKKTLSKKNDNMKQKIKVLRKQQSPLKTKELISRKKLKVCNIPCPFYQKYGICQKKDTGKCFRKHDPAQIALCTRFLQGACLKEKCLLSHRVSPEKMPTCKFYLEDSCIKENCPYLHVKLSQNAEICRDFLEGFCKEAAECKRRHQYLCPDFEKYGNCPKQRCPYPHGNMVRSYLIHKHKFTTNYSKKTKLNTEKLLQIKTTSDKNEEKQRYYIRHNSLESSISKKNSDSPNKNIIELHSRPKLGNLPSFIPLNE